MDEELRRVERQFEETAASHTAIALLRASARCRDDGRFQRALAWLADLTRWDSLETGTREALAESLVDVLGRVKFVGIRQHAMGDQTHQIAHFDIDGSDFVLVPGGQLTLGFDHEKWSANPDELESYRRTADEYELEWDINEEIARATSRPRAVELTTRT